MLFNAIAVHLLTIFASQSQAGPPPADHTPASGPTIQTLLRQVPQSQEEIQARIELARQRLGGLQPAAEVSTDGTDEVGPGTTTNREALHGVWETYLNRLERLAVLKERIADLTGERHIQAITDELSQLERETSALKRRPIPLRATQEEIKQAQADVQALEARIRALGETQTRRATLLAGGFEQQRAQLEQDLERVRKGRDELRRQVDASAPATTAPAQADGQRRELERFDVRIATAELTLHTLPLEQQETELLSKQDERVLVALRAKLQALNQQLSRLTEAQSLDRLEILQHMRAQATDPAEIALVDLHVFRERVLLHYVQDPERLNTVQQRFPDRDLQRLKERVAMSRAYWESTIASLDYRSGDEALELQRELRQELRGASRQLAACRAKLGKTLAESQDLQTVRDKVSQRFNALAEVVKAAARAKDATERTRLETEVTTLRASLDEAMRTTIKVLGDLVARLSEASELLDERAASLRANDRRIHWRRVASRDSGLLATDWSAAYAQLRALLLRPPEPDADSVKKQAGSDLQRELFGERRDDRTEAHKVIEATWNGLASVGAADWGWGITVLVVMPALGAGLMRVGRWKGVRLAREIEDAGVRPARTGDAGAIVGSGLSARVDLLGWNMLGDLAIPLLAAGGFMLAAGRVVNDETARLLFGALLACLVGAAVTLRLVHHLFEAESPPHRPIPCGDVVARHYRWWLTVLTLFSLIVLPVPLLLRVAQLAPALQNAVLEVYKAGLLALLLLFLLRKERVLGLGDVGRLHWGLMMTWIAYPVVVVAVAALLVLQIIGFGVLVTFVGTGLLLTAGIAIAVAAVAEYLVDLIDRRYRPTSSVPELKSDSDAPGDGEWAGEVEQGRTHYVIALLRWFVRVLGLAGAVVLILQVWNVPVRPEWLDWREVGLGALAILIALILDRIVFTALFTLHRSGRLPESTVNIIRRWVRGVLTIVVALTLIAVAGFEIDSIWTFLTAFLAMVAIGFVAVWSILSNILATLVILIWRPFNIGEQIEILPDGIEGQVVDINFIYTILKSDRGAKISIPNNLFAQKYIRRRGGGGEPTRTLAEQLVSEKALEE